MWLWLIGNHKTGSLKLCLRDLAMMMKWHFHGHSSSNRDLNQRLRVKSSPLVILIVVSLFKICLSGRMLQFTLCTLQWHRRRLRHRTADGNRPRTRTERKSTLGRRFPDSRSSPWRRHSSRPSTWRGQSGPGSPTPWACPRAKSRWEGIGWMG